MHYTNKSKITRYFIPQIIFISCQFIENKEFIDQDPNNHSGKFIVSLSDFLLYASIPFVGITLYFGTRNGYYDSEDYEGDGCAHDVLR